MKFETALGSAGFVFRLGRRFPVVLSRLVAVVKPKAKAKGIFKLILSLGHALHVEVWIRRWFLAGRSLVIGNDARVSCLCDVLVIRLFFGSNLCLGLLGRWPVQIIAFGLKRLFDATEGQIRDINILDRASLRDVELRLEAALNIRGRALQGPAAADRHGSGP